MFRVLRKNQTILYISVIQFGWISGILTDIKFVSVCYVTKPMSLISGILLTCILFLGQSFNIQSYSRIRSNYTNCLSRLRHGGGSLI